MKRSSLFVSIILCLALLLSLGATGVFAAEEGQEAAFVKNWGMTLNDEIVLKFEMGEIPAGATEIKATVGGRTYTAPASQQIVSVPVYATQMTEAVTLAAVDADGAAVASRSFTVLTYLQSVLDNALFASYHPLVKELLNYGSAAQLHFIGSSDITVSGAGQTAVPGNVSAYAIDDQSDLMDCTGASLVYREKIALRFYFDIDPTGCTFAVNGEAAALTVNEAGKYVEIADILPQNLDQQVVLSVTDAEGRAVSVTYSPLTYIVRMSQKGSDTTKALVKALYNYHLAAKAFVPLTDFVVSFNLGYNGEAIADRTIAVGDPYGQLPTPADRVGYTFGGWYTDAACSGEAVTAETLVTSSHTLYAKWEILADTSPLVPKYDVETGTTAVSREFIDGKDTVIFTTEGKSLINTGWQRRLEFVGNDANKEIVKFSFKYVANNNAEGTEVAPKMNFFVGGLNDTNTGHFVVTDVNGNVVHEYEVGQWYTFWGLTQGHTRIVLYPCNTTEQLRTTLYIQDRELLDYEEPIYVNQAAHAYHGTTAPYQDAEGNWKIHFRSFTGAEHHGNTAEGRQTDLIVNGEYSAVSFQFKFNVSQYAASGEALADKIDIASLNAVYFNADGVKVNIADMKVGQWYTAYVTNGGNNVATDRFYIQGYTNGTNGNTVNIDMDMRNFQGFEPDTSPVTISGLLRDGDVYKYAISGAAGKWARRVDVTAPAAKGYVAVEFRFTEAKTAAGVDFAPALGVLRSNEGNGGQYINSIIILDANGKEVVRNNTETGLTVGEWYTVIVGTKNTSVVELYAAHNYTADAPTIKMEFRERAFVEEFRNGYVVTTPDSFADPMVAWTPADGWHQNIKNNNNAISAWARRTYVTIPTDGAVQLNYEVKINSIYGDAPAQIGIMSGAMYIYEMDGTLVGYNNGHDLEIGKWYKVTISKTLDRNQNLGTNYEFVYPGTAGAQAGNVSVSFRNFEAIYPEKLEVSFSLNYEGATGAPATIQVAAGSAYGNLPTPAAREGYTFGGWTLADGTAVNADTKVTASHTLYAKWTMAEDTSLLQPSYTTETATTAVSRDFIDGKETIIFTTEGKTLINTGWQRRLGFTSNDASKEVVKFTFKFVSNNNANGEAVAPKINFFAGGLNTDNTGAYVVTDGNGNVVNELTTGVWYTFYGMTRGNTSLAFYPCNSTEQLRTTLYIQDRELLDYEPDIHIRDEAHAYYGNTAVYEDADGNWMYHFRSFSGAEHHANSAWNRRTYLDVTGDYSHVAFEFKYNVATYIAKDAEAVDKVGFAYMSGVNYFDLEGNYVAAADLKVGTWYTAVFPLPLANNWFVTMADLGGGGDTGCVVNIDMDYRNFVGFNNEGIELRTPEGIGSGLPGDAYWTYTKADGWHMIIADNGQIVSDWNRRVQLKTAVGYKSVTFEVKISDTNACPATFRCPSGKLYFYDMETDTYLGNTPTLTIGAWYKVVYVPTNAQSGAWVDFVYPGAYYDAGGNLTVSYRNFATHNYFWSVDDGQAAASVSMTTDDGEPVWKYTNFGHTITNDPWGRRMILTIPNNTSDTISMKVKITSVVDGSGADIATRSIVVHPTTSTTLSATFIDENGVAVPNANLELNKWYTMSFVSNGTASYAFWTFAGVAQGEILIKDVTVTPAS